MGGEKRIITYNQCETEEKYGLRYATKQDINRKEVLRYNQSKGASVNIVQTFGISN